MIASGPAVFNRYGFAVNFVRDKDIVVHANFERKIGGVAVVAFEEDEFGIVLWFDQIREREEGNAFPFHFELAPGGDAMEITHIFELRERSEFLPTQSDWIFNQSMNF